jgi:mannosyltransferase
MALFTSPNPARARSFLWAVVALTAAAAAVRFATLGLQSYRHDEAVTAGRVLFASLPKTMHEVWAGESTPPLYYVLAWAWSHLFGVREVGLRSLSALFGTATVPVAYLIGRELSGRRTGLALAALVAFEPMLVWYSQDARSYALLILLCAAALLFFLRAKRTGEPRDLAWWAVLSALSLATHYYAFFPLAIEAAWLLAVVRPLRRPAWAVAGIAAAGLALAPIAVHQAQGKNNDWIATFRMTTRLREAGIAFLVGEAGLLRHALIPLALAAVAVGLLLVRGSWREKRGASVALAIGAGSIVLALVFAAGGQDFVLARNLLPALIPLALVVAAGLGARRSGRLGIGVGAALVGYMLAFCIYSDFRPALQRDNWRSVAAAIGSPRRPRAILVWEQGDEPLAFYIGGGETRVKWKQWRRRPVPVAEVDVVSGRPPPPGARGALPPEFHQVQRTTLGRMTLIRYRAPRPRAVGWGRIAHNFTGYSNNAVLIDRPHPAPTTGG